MFVDKVKITIKSGNGGNGIVSFLRYKGISKGGPDGGDGGKGGDIIFVGDKNLTSLVDFYYKKRWTATDGDRGAPKNCQGRGGVDLIIPVPLGTVARDAETDRIICDVFRDGERAVVLEGGKGGKGNARFTTARRKAPHFSQLGEVIEPKKIVLELKTIADVGLVGFPNAGKSTLLSQLTKATPKIADYPFTTLSPNLGVARLYDESFTVADIPGLIEGASRGVGLGIDFLRHIERTRMLVHVIDLGEDDPVSNYRIIMKELKAYSKELAARPMIIALNKIDLADDQKVKAFRKSIRKPVFVMSAAIDEGVKELEQAIVDKLKELPKVEPLEFEPFTYKTEDRESFEIERDNEAFVVIGPLVDTLIRNVLLSDQDSLAYMQSVLKKKGVIKALKAKGLKDGDTVEIGDIEFDYTE